MSRRLSDVSNALEERQSSGTPIIVTSKCADSIYPGLLTQSGTGPGIGGFELAPGKSRTLSVGNAWQGRVWGRTNCSFNDAGTAPAQRTSNGRACTTGDCGGIVDCKGTGEVPTTLVEWTLDTGNGQTFYDISLVDGYNLPMAVVLVAHSNASLESIPPNLTNPSCVGTVGDLAPEDFDPYENGDFLGCNASNPMPFDTKVTANQAATWCPSNLEVNPQQRPQDGVYTYPDGNIQRPPFDPCFSACAKNNQPSDCCTGAYNSPSACSPSSYSKAAKAVCPDAYSYAFDDQTSTFIIPAGAGFEVIFCPGGRSTNILATSKKELTQLAQQGHVKRSFGMVEKADLLTRGMDLTRIGSMGMSAMSDGSLANSDELNELPTDFSEGLREVEERSQTHHEEVETNPALLAQVLEARADVAVTSTIHVSVPTETLSTQPVQTILIKTGNAPGISIAFRRSQLGTWLAIAILALL